MDLHLEYIVNQTAKYSDWLAKGLGKVGGHGSAREPSLHSTALFDGNGDFCVCVEV